jgi:hypothetical protein
MTFYVLVPLGTPYQISADNSDWHKKLSDVNRRATVSDIWMRGNGKLNPKEMPESLPLKKGPKSLPAVFFSNGGIVVCSGELKSIIEELDPGLHQFILIKVILKTGQDAPGTHFILNVHHTLDTIVDEMTKSTKGSWTLPDDPKRHGRYLSEIAPKAGDVTVSRTKLTKTNLWREKAYPDIYMMSDLLHDRIKNAGMRFFKTVKAAEI